MRADGTAHHGSALITLFIPRIYAGLALNSWVLLANLATNIVGSTRQKTSQLAKNIDENTNTKNDENQHLFAKFRV